MASPGKQKETVRGGHFDIQRRSDTMHPGGSRSISIKELHAKTGEKVRQAAWSNRSSLTFAEACVREAEQRRKAVS
jgi:hypothetical protein